MNIVDLGLVHRVDISSERVLVEFTLTSPACPLAEYLSEEMHRVLEGFVPEGVAIELKRLLDHEWDPLQMSAHAKHKLGW